MAELQYETVQELDGESKLIDAGKSLDAGIDVRTLVFAMCDETRDGKGWRTIETLEQMLAEDIVDHQASKGEFGDPQTGDFDDVQIEMAWTEVQHAVQAWKREKGIPVND